MIDFFNSIIGRLILIIAQERIKKDNLLNQKHYLINEKMDDAIRCKILFPNILIHSVISIEDRRYFNHTGVDFYSICRAIIKNIISKRLEGASTIEQQFVRSVTGNRKIDFKRKIDEILLASMLSAKYKKPHIITAYLLIYPFDTSFGMIDLCKNENCDLQNISPYQAASLAARLKYPYLNQKNYNKYLKRVRTIEKKLHLIPKSHAPEGARGSSIHYM